MRLSRYFLPILRETPKEAEIVSHRLMLRAGMMRQEAAGIYAFLPLGFRVLAEDLRDRARGAEPLRRHRTADADHPVGRSLARERALRGLWQGNAAHQGPPRARHAVRADQRGDDHRDLPLLCALVQGSSAQSLPHPVEIPRRGAPALRADARPRIPDEGRLFVRSRPERRAAFLQQDVRRLSAHLRAARTEIDPDAREVRADRRRSEPRIHHPGLDRRVGSVLPQGLSRPAGAAGRREFRRHRRPAGDRRQVDVAICRDLRHARRGGLRQGAGRQTSVGARHRGRAYLLFRHQIFRADEGGGRDRRGHRGAGAHGLLRHRALAPGRRHHRGFARRCRHHLAGAGGAVQGGDPQPEAGRGRHGCRLRAALPRPHRQGRRSALRRPRRARRRQIRHRRPDRYPLAGAWSARAGWPRARSR